MLQLSPAVREIFERILLSAGQGGIAEARADVRAHLDRIRTAAKHNPLLAVDLADALAGGLDALLDLAGDLAAADRALVIAACRYFASETDAVSDTSGVLGLDDDLAVFNYVVDQLGLSDRKLDL